jgi:hypothetical protein
MPSPVLRMTVTISSIVGGSADKRVVAGVQVVSDAAADCRFPISGGVGIGALMTTHSLPRLVRGEPLGFQGLRASGQPRPHD